LPKVAASKVIGSDRTKPAIIYLNSSALVMEFSKAKPTALKRHESSALIILLTATNPSFYYSQLLIVNSFYI
jgi:hypothetical protein